MEINRRKFHRIPASREPCVVKVDNLQLTGILADESISGAKIANLDLLMMPYNKALTLEHRDGVIDVRARNAYRGEDDTFLMGVVRTETLSPEQLNESAAMLVNCYFQHQGAYVICMPIHIETQNQVLIQLWDGVQFRVPRSQLSPLTRAERFEMLGDHNCLAYTAAMYGFEIESHEYTRQKVFEHEFGAYENCPMTTAVVES